MGLAAMLAAVIIIILLLVFGHSTLSPFNSSSPNSPKTIRDRAQDAVKSTNENSKVQQNQIKNIEIP